MMKPPLAGLLPDLSGPVRAPDAPLPPDATSLDFLQSVYRDHGQPLSVRMRAAIAALPFERPKLAVVATVGSFAAEMKTIARERGRSMVIDARPLPQPADNQ